MKKRDLVFLKPLDLEDPVVALGEFQSDLLHWMPRILDGSTEMESSGLYDAKMTRHYQLLRTLKAHFQGDSPVNAHQYPSVALIEALRGCWLLRSSRNLKKMAHHVVSACTPPAMHGTLRRYIDLPMHVP